MPKFVKKLLIILLLLPIVSQITTVTFVRADNSCSANVTPHFSYTNATVDFSIQITNTAVESVRWISIQTPSGNFTVQGGSASGWDINTDSSNVSLTSGILSEQESLAVTITTAIGDQPAALANWLVTASYDGGGSEAFACLGDLGTEVLNPSDPPVISNISVGSITTSSAVVSWKTNEPATSQVNYGTSQVYTNSTTRDSNAVTNHSQTLSSLTANTGYHLQIVSDDELGNSGFSGDNTFVTLAASATVSTQTNPTIAKLNLKQTEKIPPSISITTDFSKPFTQTPKITGVAEDNQAIFLVEYSTDGGRNWLPATIISGQGTAKADFDFVPVNLEDGNYLVLGRAIDTSGNIGITSQKTLIIDRLPPIVGAGVISIGPQILKPDQDGIVSSVLGVDQKVTVNSVGGATHITIRSVDSSSKSTNAGQIYALSRSTQTGLWSGILSFSEEGLHDLTVEAIDGAGNKTSRDFSKIYIASSGRITSKDSGKNINQAKITLHYLEPDSNSWVVWDGSSYGQKNPQQTDTDGRFTLFVPKGRYYLDVSAPQYNTAASNIFTVTETVPIGQNIVLDKAFKLGFGSLSLTIPSLQINKIQIKPSLNLNKVSVKGNSLVGKLVPSFSLQKTSGELLNQVQLSGRPTLISFVSSWSPSSQEQFQVLDKLQKNLDLNIAPVAVLESTSKLAAYKVISKLNLNFLADPDGTTVNSFGYQSLPTHYFINRKGLIKKVMVGVLSEKEILEGLGSL